jgi:exosortase/archaeosortase family protein
VATAPVLGLSVLSLPLLASLQFYAGFPLRVVTAEASRWLLSIAHTVERTGSSLVVNGQLIIVDAPCSGVQMAWLGYFTACVATLATRISNKTFLLRLPIVGALVLMGNVLRNTVLVAARGVDVPDRETLTARAEAIEARFALPALKWLRMVQPYRAADAAA